MLKTRALTALAGMPVLLFFAYLGKYWYAILILFLSFLALREYFALARKGGWKPFETAGYIFIPAVLLAVYQSNLLLVISILVLLFAFLNFLPVFFQGRVKYWESAVTFWGIIYTGGLAGFLLAIRLLPDGFLLTIFLFFVIWSADIFAYLVGRKFGKRPLASRISPKKTVEGFLAGLTGSAVIGSALMFFFPLPYLNWQGGALLGFLSGFVGTIGDLSQSAMKRSVGAKDSGSLLPGHGGILDRFDSLFFTAPFFYFYLYFTGMI